MATQRTVVLEQLADAAGRTAAALRAALDETVPPPRRPVDLVRSLGLDKTLASRIVRFAESDNPVERLAEGPGPSGLRQVARGVAAAGVDAAGLNAAIDALEAALGGFPAGRAGLDAALAEEGGASRDAIQRAARQGLYKSMTVLMGCQLDSAYHIHTLVESRVIPGRIDSYYMEQREGFRRLREGTSRAIVCGVPAPHPHDAAVERTVLLDGSPIGSDPHAALIHRFCSEHLPRLETARRGASLLLCVDPGVPPPGEPLTVAAGLIAQGTTPRWATPERKFDSFGVTMRKPVAVMVFDLLVHRSLGIGRPMVTLNVAGGPAPVSPRSDDFDAIDQEIAIEPMGRGTKRLGCRDVPDARAIAEHVVASTGNAPEDFDAYRVLVEYPAPGLMTRVWIPLPERGTAG